METFDKVLLSCRSRFVLVGFVLNMVFIIPAKAGEQNTLTNNEPTINSIKQEKYTVLKEPKTVEELLLNLKYIYEHDWLLNADFYTEATLNHVIGGDCENLHTRYVYMGKRIDHFIDGGSLRSFGQNFKYLQSSSDKEAQPFVTSIQTGFKRGESSWISLSFIVGAVSFEKIEKLFGKGWEFDQNLPPEGWTPPPPTSQNGNALILYKNDTKKLEKLMGLWTHHDGSIYELSFQIKEKNNGVNDQLK